MESICDHFEEISFDAGPIQCKDQKLIKGLDPYFIPVIEYRFEEYEKVSFSFLFFDDIRSCLDICEKCVNNCNYSFMSDNSLDKYPNWDEKFVECIFNVQHILLLRKLRIGMYDAERVFKRSKYVSKQRLLLYKICENLSNAETLQIMESIPSLSPEKYLEIFILKILLLDNGLKSFISSLSMLKNPVINTFLEEMNIDSYDRNSIKAIQSLNPLPRSAILSEAEIYRIKDPKSVGLCFIINQVNFVGQEKREGSSEDVTLLKSTMEYFNIEVKIFTDVPKKCFDDLDTNIDIHFKEKNYSVFFMVIMSHGVPDAVYSSDDKPIQINYIISKLCFKSLHKIPKVLIIQACQGQFLLEDMATDGPTCLQFDQVPEKRFKFAGHISDFLITMATVKGFKAFRDTKRGSWFVQALCKCMKDHENDCILSIITKTIRQVKDHSLPIYKHRCIQQPEFRSLLEKKLYLKPIINN